MITIVTIRLWYPWISNRPIPRKLYREITSEEALQLYTGYILATPEIGLRLSDNPDLYHLSVSGNKHSYATLPSQEHYTYMKLLKSL